MELATALKSAETLLQPWALSMKTPQEDRLDVNLPADQLPAAVAALKAEKWGYLSAITCIDHSSLGGEQADLPVEAHLEVLYHFCHGAAVLSLRVDVPHSLAVVPSICEAFPVATLYERELIEMFGLRVDGTPDTSRLLLPDDWPDGVYPLRKEFTGLDAPAVEG